MMQLHVLQNYACSRRASIIMLGMIFLGIAACAPILSPGDPPAYIQFMPEFQTMSAGNAKTRTLQLAVPLPTTPAELSSDAMILLLNGRELRRLAGYRWSSSVPEMSQRAIIGGLESSGAFASVSGTGAGIRPNARLVSDMDQFAFEYPEDKAGKPVATLRFTFRLVEYSTGTVLGTLPVSVQQTAASREVEGMAKAAEKAMADVVAKLNAWLVDTLR